MSKVERDDRTGNPQRTGSIHRYAPARPGEPQGHYVVRCSAPDGTRPLFHLKPSPKSPQAEERAKESAAGLTEQLWAKGLGAAPVRARAEKARAAVGDPEAETVAGYAERWFKDRERRGLSSVATDRGRFTNHVGPVLGPQLIRQVTRDEIRAVVEHLDEATRRGAFSWRTAVKVWGLVTKMFSDACDSKVAALRVRSDNPCAGLPGPDRGERKAKQWLYPVEASALLACPDVPLRWRRLYALATYLYLRPGELAALEWADVNADQRYVSVHQALDMRTGEAKATKTGITRKVPIRPELAPLLEAMRDESGGEGRVIQNTHANKEAEHGFPPLEDLAATLRAHLHRAGVDRADLFADRATTKRLTFYDLRATGITWEVLARTEHVRIMQRAGHRNFSTTQGYIREAEAVGLDAGEPFPPLPPSLRGQSGHSLSGPLPQELPQRSGPRVSEPEPLQKKGVPNGIRTRVTALKGPCPGPG